MRVSLTPSSCLNSPGQHYPWFKIPVENKSGGRFLTPHAILLSFLSVVLWVSRLPFLNIVRSRASVVGNARHLLVLLGQSCFAFKSLSPQVPIPPMQSFKFALWSFLASALAVCAVRNITVDDFDPRIVYTPSSVWTHENVSLVASLLRWPMLIYESRRVVPHWTDLILPRATLQI